MRPLLDVIFGELKARGWKISSDGLRDPEGNLHASVSDAITAETLREIATFRPETAECQVKPPLRG